MFNEKAANSTVNEGRQNMSAYQAMKLANLWRENPQGCEHFGITGDVVYEAVQDGKMEFSSPRDQSKVNADISARTVPSLTPYPFRKRMQDMAKRFGTWSFHPKGLVSKIDGELWEIAEFI